MAIEDALLEEPPVEELEEAPAPGILDPIKEKGLLRGGLDIATMMVPGAVGGQMAADRARASGGFTTQDLFASLKDVADEASYGVPGIGEVRGFQMGTQLVSDGTDWLTKGMGALGIAGLPLSAGAGGLHAAGVLGFGLPGRAMTAPGRQTPKIGDIHPVVVGYSRPDDLSFLSGQPMVTGGLIPTTTDLAQQAMVALNGINNEFRYADRITRLRNAITGRRKKDKWVPRRTRNATQVEGFLDGIGRDLLDKNRFPDYDKSLQSPGMDPPRLRVSAAAFEVSKFDTMARRGLISVEDGFGDVLTSWDRMKAGEVLDFGELNDLHVAMLEHAELTASIAHPQMALYDDLRFAVVGTHLGGPNKGVTLAHTGFDGVPAGTLTEADLVGRLNSMALIQPEGMATRMVENLTEFFHDQVVRHWDRLAASGLTGADQVLGASPTTGAGAIEWYRRAMDDTVALANFHRLNQDKLVGIASLTSAGQMWETNLDKAVIVALHLRDNPGISPQQLSDDMNRVGQKVTLPEAKNIVELNAVPDTEVQAHFQSMLESGTAMKQPNFTLAIINSSADQSAKQAGLVYAMSKGLIPASEADGLFATLGMTVPLVIDRHAINLAFGGSFNPSGTISDNVYPIVRRAYEIAAEAVGPQMIGGVERNLSPSELQALLWVEWREWRGVTKNYGITVPDTGKMIHLPRLFIEGVGSNQVYNNRILKFATEPLPQQITYAGEAGKSRGVWLTAEQLRGRHKPGSRHSKQPSATRRGLTPQGRPGAYTVALSHTSEGLFVVRPDGAVETLRNLYPSVGWTAAGQILRPGRAAPVVSIDTQMALMNAAIRDRTDGLHGLTGYRVETAGHTNPLLDDGRHIAISAAAFNPDGSERAMAGHLELIALLRERGIEFTHVVDPMHQGQASVWTHKGRQFWSRQEVTDAGLNPDHLPVTLEPENQRLRMVLSFTDAQAMHKAMMLLQEPRPHRVNAAQTAAQGAMSYVSFWGRELGLRVPHGIKRQALHLGTEPTSPVAGHRTVFDPVRAEEIARAYEAAPIQPSATDRRATRRSYRRFVQEVEAQYKHMVDELGITHIVETRDPYGSPQALMDDINNNSTIRTMATSSTGSHPLLTDAQNDMFRAVHDFYGHSAMGNNFNRHGEVVAYLKHAQMFSELARGALFSETMAQASTLIRRNSFPPQKAVLMPRRFWSDDTLFNDPSLMKGSDVGRRLDSLYGEEVLDLVAYTNGDHEAPYGTVGVYEHQYVEPSGRRLVQLSGDADPGAANAGKVYIIEHDGLYPYIKDSENMRHSRRSSTDAESGKPLHRFTDDGSTWDNMVRVVNADVVDKGSDAIRASRHMFDVKIDGRSPTSIAVYVPPEGTGIPEMVYNRRTVAGREASRVVVLTRTSRGDFKRGLSTVEIEAPGNADGAMNSNLIDDAQQLLRRGGWIGEISYRPRGT